MPEKIPVLAVVGPTASGKTALSIALAKALDGEIISADSMQIYKGMDIASAKPTKEERAGIPHHMMGVVSPETPYSVADYVKDAGKAIADVWNRKKCPILVGGTGLYVDSLLSGTRFIPSPTDLELRKELQAQYDALGGEAMLQKLKAFDPESAARLHPNNNKRIIRAFEVYRLTGKTMTEALENSHSEPSRYKPVYIGINFADRAVLYDRINRRVDLMLENGLLDEAKDFFEHTNATAAQAIGYKELKPYFDGEVTLDEAEERLKQVTRNYAKRQLTWFKRNPEIHWLYPDTCTKEEFLRQALKIAETVKL